MKNMSDCSASSQSTSGRPSGADRSDRREFLRTGTAVSAGVAAGLTAAPAVHTAAASESSPETVRLALIGAGGRGGGAINDSLTINDNVQLVSIADLQEDKPARLRDLLAPRYGDKVKVSEKKLHAGIDAYKRVLDDPEVDVVLFATPPGFRPAYVLDAVEAGKHVFAEKPTCVDPAGYRVCLKAHRKAEENGTAIVTGTQYRRQENYKECIRRIHEGQIGDVISARTRYCTNGIWFRQPQPGMSDTEAQIFNWMHHIWLSGDQIAEQAVHNIDTLNWLMGGPPINAYGSGGRFTRPDGSEMWDNMEIDYEYPDGRLLSFMCRQIPSTQSENGSVIYGTTGRATILGGNSGASIVSRDGKEIWSMKGNIGAAYKQEHKDLVDSIRAGKPIVELKETADSSLTAVMGRMAAYTGQKVSWDFVTQKSDLSLFPEDFDINGSRPEPKYAVPGKQELT